MISATSITNQFALQPTLLAKHKKTLEWLSAAVLWKRELAFFQKLLSQYASKFSKQEDKAKIDHFQSIILYYNGELIDALCSNLRLHEKHLASMLETKNESNTEYFKEHAELMNELESANTQLTQYKEELYNFVEKVM